MELKNKVAIVTGGTKGIGEAISIEFVKSGIKVCSTYVSDDKNANRFENEIKKITSEYMIMKSDISNIDDISNLFKDVIDKFGGVDILVNNAGIFLTKDGYPETDKRYKKVFETNFFSCVYATEKFGEVFKGDLGKIINISSIAGINPFSYTGGIRAPEYDCSKASMDLYTKIMARTFNGKILVNGIAPGSTETPQWDGTDENFLNIRAKESMINRFMKPQEISKTALFLLQNDAINGDIIIVDGGNILN
ncbi:MAG: SDR family oxidoreductase [Candidatus Gracilibacteria bacterium]